MDKTGLSNTTIGKQCYKLWFTSPREAPRPQQAGKFGTSANKPFEKISLRYVRPTRRRLFQRGPLSTACKTRR